MNTELRKSISMATESDLAAAHPTLHVCGLNHDRAPLAVRERFALAPEQCLKTLARMSSEGICREALVLSTCNRTEVYAFSSGGEAFSDELEEFFVTLARPGIEPGTLLPLYSYDGHEAARHFFAVGSGLDSMILGENEIKAQITQAFELSRQERMAGPNLHRLIEAAHRCVKRVKTETDLNAGTLSVGRAAVLKAEEVLGTLAGKVCMVIGAGKVGRVAAMGIAERRPARLILVNRSVERAREVGEGLNAEIVSIPEMAPAIQAADLIIGAAFAPNFLVTRPMFESLRRQSGAEHPVCLIDTAVPRILDQAIGEVPGVTLSDIGQMESIVAENRARRMAAAQHAWLIVEDEVDKFRRRLDHVTLGPTVERLKGQFEALFAEMQASLDDHLPADVRERVRVSQHKLKQRLLHAAIQELRGLKEEKP